MDEIESRLPHRYPFLFVDRLVERAAGEYARGYKNVTRNEWFFQGHFPDEAIMPGVLIVEAIAQVAAFACEGGAETRGNGKLASVRGVQFKEAVVPGDRLELIFRVTAARGTFIKGEGYASVEGKVVCRAEEMTLYVPR